MHNHDGDARIRNELDSRPPEEYPGVHFEGIAARAAAARCLLGFIRASGRHVEAGDLKELCGHGLDDDAHRKYAGVPRNDADETEHVVRAALERFAQPARAPAGTVDAYRAGGNLALVEEQVAADIPELRIRQFIMKNLHRKEKNEFE